MVNEKLSCWFGLSYASFLTMPRVLIESMPEKWQEKMAELLCEYDEVFCNRPDIGTRVLITKNGKLVKTPEWLLNYRRPDMAEINKLKQSKRLQ